jgi:hypothetical protein
MVFMDTNYKPNSNKYKEEQRKAAAENEKKPQVQKVVSGPVAVRKKTGIQKFADSFINDDMPKIKNYIVSDVLIPSIKKAISDIVRNGIDMVLYGESSRNRDSKTPGSRVSYRSYYDNPVGSRDRDRSSSSRSVFDYDDVEFLNRGDAELTLAQMEDIIEKYGFVKVADYYDLAGVSITNHCANNYGWTDLRTANISRVRDGRYVINLPKALPID